MDQESDTEEADERERLVRFCARWTGDPEAAEDLAQLTLIEAWKSSPTLRDPGARRSWLFGIARHQCLSWGRRRAQQQARELALSDALGNHSGVSPDPSADLDIELERDDLAWLLDRALDRLPPGTRSVLIERYIQEAPQRELALRMGLSESAIEARLHRGKLALRRIIDGELRDEAAELGLFGRESHGWQPTRIWCPLCGTRRLQGAWTDEGLALRCPDCTPAGASLTNGGPAGLFDGIRGFKPALTRLITHAEQWVRDSAADGTAQCPRCGEPLPLTPGFVAFSTERRLPSVGITCRFCGVRVDQTVVAAILALPQARRFWRDHPRMRLLPHRQVGAGTHALLVPLESVTDRARLDVVVDGKTFELRTLYRVG